MVILLIESELSLSGSEKKRTRAGRAGYWCARAEERTPKCREENDAFREGTCFMC